MSDCLTRKRFYFWQMGSNFKSAAVLEEQTTKVMKQWHAEVKKKRKKKQDSSQSGHDEDSTTVGSSRGIINSPDFSSHRRQLPFAEITQNFPGKTEIVDDNQEIVEDQQQRVGQNEIELASNVSSSEVHVEMPEVTTTQT